MKEIITVLFGAMLLVGCNTTASKQDEVSSKLQRDLEPNVSDAELSQLVADNNKFAHALFQNLDSSEENIFFSPISISHALMMTYAAAAGETKQEMKTALNLTLEDDRVHEAFNKLDLGLNMQEDTDIFKIANSIWPSKDFEFEENYLDAIMVNYGASLKTLDYQNKPEDSRKEINSWVEDKTEDKIKDLIPEGLITPLTKMVLSNATYFKGEWEHAFNPDNTQKGFFNNSIDVEYMNQTEVFPYYEDESLQAVKLDYKSGKNSMIIILPKGDSYDIKGDFTKHRVTLKMPKFEFTSKSISLVDTMKTLGMNRAFDNNADFSLMSSSSSLKIGDIIHKAFIKVDEQGTEAAAATVVLLVMKGGIVGVPTATLTLDKPFIYMIVDNETDQILFMGHMLKP